MHNNISLSPRVVLKNLCFGPRSYNFVYHNLSSNFQWGPRSYTSLFTKICHPISNRDLLPTPLFTTICDFIWVLDPITLFITNCHPVSNGDLGPTCTPLCSPNFMSCTLVHQALPSNFKWGPRSYTFLLTKICHPISNEDLDPTICSPKFAILFQIWTWVLLPCSPSFAIQFQIGSKVFQIETYVLHPS